ncbi:recombinase family protein [Eubacteriaceae bacterium ES2]|nr:recombinase family protein [Eubacteriaceae bacterium ES2]
MSKSEKVIKNAVIYARFSSKMQNDGASIDLQLDACNEFARKNGYSIVRNYVDEAISGTKESQRVQFMQMISDAENQEFSTVLVYKYNRFARNLNLQLKYEDLLDQSGVSLVAVTENYGDSHQAKLLKLIASWSAENDVIQISENVLRGQKSRARECRHCGGLPPLGYDVDPVTKHLVLSANTDEITAVKIIFDMRSKGYTYQEISDALTKAGVNRSKKGHSITKTTMLSILKNEKYMGIFVFNKSSPKDKRGKRNGHRQKNDSEIIKIPGGCPSIIDEQTFEQAQHVRKNSNAAAGRARAKRHYLLSGLLYCSCGAAYTAHYRNERPGHKSYANYVCSGRQRNSQSTCQNRGIEMTTLDAVVMDLIQKILLQNAQSLTDYLNISRSEKHTNLESNVQSLQRKIIEADKKITNLSSAIADGLYDQTLQNQLKNLIQTKTTLTEQIRELQSSTDSEPVLLETVKEKLGKLSSFMQSNNIREVQMAVSSIIDKIIIHQEHVEIILKIPVSQAKDNSNFAANQSVSREHIKNKQYDGSYLPDSEISELTNYPITRGA